MKIIKMILISFLFINGCATVEHSGMQTIARETDGKIEIKIKSPLKNLRLGEKLTYNIRWFGIPVGTAVFWVCEKIELNGRQVYHVISTAKSNLFASTLYRVNDEMHTYLDCENLYSLKYEKHLREGSYIADEVVEYDQVNHQASYKSQRKSKNNKVTSKDITVPIPEAVQDPFSCLYYFRTIDADKIKAGQSVFIKVNTEEKNWDLEMAILETKRMELLNMGVFDAFLVEPKTKFQGIFVRKGRMWIWVSADERRLPLILKTKVPIVGTVYATLEKIE